MGKKIAVIGAGSVYVAGILRTLVARAQEMAGTELVLEDIEPRRLETMRALASNLVRARRADLNITATLDLDEALDGADFVLTCFRIGGYDALKLDEDIPLAYDIFGEETAGPGGMFFALRTVPVVVDIARRMERLCPDAFLINYANPTAFVADAVRRTTSIEELSLCDGYRSGAVTVANLLGLEEKDVTVFTAGVNHCTWLLRAFVNGKDVCSEFRRKLAELDRTDLGWTMQRVYDIADTCGYLPVPGGHIVQYFFRQEAVTRLKEGLGPSVYRSHMADQPVLWEHYEKLARADDPRFDMSIPALQHYASSVSDMAISVIIAIATDARELFTVNLPNRGQIPNLPSDAIVEGPAVVGAFGAEPVMVGRIPDAVLPLTEALAMNRKLTVEAALTGDRNMLLQALMTNPLVDSLGKAKPMMDEMLAAQAQWLPQFAM